MRGKHFNASVFLTVCVACLPPPHTHTVLSVSVPASPRRDPNPEKATARVLAESFPDLKPFDPLRTTPLLQALLDVHSPKRISSRRASDSSPPPKNAHTATATRVHTHTPATHTRGADEAEARGGEGRRSFSLVKGKKKASVSVSPRPKAATPLPHRAAPPTSKPKAKK